jgi:hypothetical protein
MKTRRLVVLAALGVGLASSGMAENRAEYRVGAGIDYSTGDYGDSEDTDILSIPLLLRYSQFPWTLKATIPWIQVKGPGDVVGGIDGPVTTGGSAGEVTTESGLGDIILAATYMVDPWSEAAPSLDLTCKAKLPTADEDKQLGTGEPDYSLQVDLSKNVGAWTPFLTLGYQFMGSSDELALDNRVYGSLGVSAKASKTLTIGTVYDYRQAAKDSSDDSHEVGLFGTWRVSPQWRVSAYGSVGLSDGAPDLNVGLQTQRTL